MKALPLLFLLLPLQATAQTSAIDLSYARTYFDELKQLGELDGTKLWGRPVAGPMIFADRTTRMVVANMADLEGKLKEQDGVWVGSLPAEHNVANAALDWAGRRWAMIGWPVSDNKYTRGRLLMHESFHRIQDELGLTAGDPINVHMATASARIWLRLEYRALAEALLRQGAQRTEGVKDALTFRARRRHEFKDAAEQERLLELNEGLAEYTGYALSGLPRAALPDRIAVQLAQYEQQDNFARSFAYASGPAYALLLDLAGKPWRKAVTRTTDLSALAAAAYRIAGVQPDDADALVNRYAGERMIAEERAKEERRVAAEARLRALLVDGPTLTLPVLADFRYSFDPNGAVPIADSGIAFEQSRVTDSWGVLAVSSGGVLMRRSPAGITAVAVPVAAAEIAPTKGDGWELELNPGWTIRAGARKGDWVVVRE